MVLSTRAVLSVDGDDEAVAAEGAVHERRIELQRLLPAGMHWMTEWFQLARLTVRGLTVVRLPSGNCWSGWTEFTNTLISVLQVRTQQRAKQEARSLKPDAPPPASVADLASASATHLLPDAPPHVTHLLQIPDTKHFERFKKQLLRNMHADFQA